MRDVAVSIKVKDLKQGDRLLNGTWVVEGVQPNGDGYLVHARSANANGHSFFWKGEDNTLVWREVPDTYLNLDDDDYTNGEVPF